MSAAPAARVRLALVGALTVWVTTLGWRGFTEAWAAALVPLLGLALVVALSGAALRRLALPGVVVVLGQVLLGGAAASLVLTGSPLPVGAAGEQLVGAFEAAARTSVSYAAPVPSSAPGIHPLLIAGGLGCLLLVDVLAVTLRRVPLAGLPLLAVYSVPVSVLGEGASWWLFVAAAAGFLLMLHLDAGDTVTRWGRGADGTDRADGADGADGAGRGLGVRTGAAAAGATALGAGALGLAVVVPLALPGVQLDLLGSGSGDGGDGQISVENPMVDLRRDLKQGADFPLVRVRTEDPRPDYLRISVLANFTEQEWTSGDRSVPANQVADGALPPIEGLDPQVPRDAYTYEVEVTSDFGSTWLPTQAPASRVVADGDWRYDTATMDFIAADEDLSTAGTTYEMTAIEPRVDAAALADAPATRGEVDSRFLELPAGLPPVVSSLTDDVTTGLANNFDRAVALQDFFRRTGGFQYSLERSEDGSGTDELARFLTPGPEGRVGYCEQFAAAMAVMAREVGIPARVAVGFLEPRRLPDGRWEYSARDLHAWPELYFPGAGWTRFEPTPPARAADVPAYTAQEEEAEALPDAPRSDPERDAGPELDRAEQREDTAPVPDPAVPDAEPGGAPPRVLLGAPLVVLGLLAAGLTPALVRRRRRDTRLAGGPDAAWAELRDTVVDLRLPWPPGRSPREVRDAVAPSLASHEALDLLVAEVERSRYARTASPDGGAAGAAARTCVADLEQQVGRRRRRRARWWPRSVVRRGERSRVPADQAAERAGGSAPVAERLG